MKWLTCLFAACAMTAGGLTHAALVHRYTFDDADIVGSAGAGDVVGSADATPTGTNGGTNIATGQPGVLGEAYSFTEDDTGDFNDLAEFENLLTAPSGAAPSGSAARTFTTWFNVTNDDGDQNKLFGYGAPTADNTFDISFEVGGIRLRTFGGNITYGGGLFDFAGTDAGWHHLAVRHDGTATFSGVSVFIDGVELAVTASGGNALTDSIDTTDSVFGIGTTGVAGSAVNQGFEGLLDDFRIYDNALTDGQIGSLVPEPSACLLALGGVLLAMAARRRD